MPHTKEQIRLRSYRDRKENWKKWGPYISERAWGTVREDYSHNGNAWEYFPHNDAPKRAFRWGEDAIAGICDRHQHLCLGVTLWNGRDAILKERLFGVNGKEGNHGEDVKEYYYYLDNTPTHSYMSMRYKYPQAAFPYENLVVENLRRGTLDPEYELLDTGVFNGHQYFDVDVTYAKAKPEDILMRVSAANRGSEPALCYLIPTLWFRNTWSWGYSNGPMGDVSGKPMLKIIDGNRDGGIEAIHPTMGTYYLYAAGQPEWLFTENETRVQEQEPTGVIRYCKDAFHRYMVHNERIAVNPEKVGTKAGAVYTMEIAPGQAQSIHLRLSDTPLTLPFNDFNSIFEIRRQEADEFFTAIQKPELGEEERWVQRQAFAGMLWSKQFYYYDVEQWLNGDPGMTPPPVTRFGGRNRLWEHLLNFDIISMPDKWEYPWYAAWDLAFHCIPLALVDSEFAKRQLTLISREWYMHPNGQLPAYEWAFGDVNPPVHAWAALRVYQIDAEQQGQPDRHFLESIFHKLLLNFTWWVNKKDMDGNNIFEGGFLGLDNISVFDRSKPLPTGGQLEQSDGTAWMAFFCIEMLKIAFELAHENPVYQDTASKFFEHFLRIANAMAGRCRNGVNLWDEQDGFFYDAIHLPNGETKPLKVRSLVGLIPLLAVETLDQGLLEKLPDFKRRMDWFIAKRSNLLSEDCMACAISPGEKGRRLLSIVNEKRLHQVLRLMLDENEFLSDFGIRSLSKHHLAHPFRIQVEDQEHMVNYQPAESSSGLFGGNSNWRGPIWFPLNYLLIEALERFYLYYGDTLQVEYPTGSGQKISLDQVAGKLSRRLIKLFLRNSEGNRPIYGNQRLFQEDPHWNDLLLFSEYFHGDNGAGLGASHQTGWTGLIAELIQQFGGPT